MSKNMKVTTLTKLKAKRKVKNILKITLITFLLASCGESFMYLETSDFNRKIENRNNIETPEALITLFYNYPENEGKPNLTITTKKLDSNKFEITLIHDHLQDDSQSAVKYVMFAEKNGEIWKAIEVKSNWKCYPGRGHETWGTTNCD